MVKNKTRGPVGALPLNAVIDLLLWCIFKTSSYSGSGVYAILKTNIKEASHSVLPMPLIPPHHHNYCHRHF